MQSPSQWRCSDGINIGHWTFDIEHLPRRRGRLGRTDCCRRGAGIDPASGYTGAHDPATDGGAARRRSARCPPRRAQHDSLSRDGRGGSAGLHAESGVAAGNRPPLRPNWRLSARLSDRGVCGRCDRSPSLWGGGGVGGYRPGAAVDARCFGRLRGPRADPPGWSRTAGHSHRRRLGRGAPRHMAVPAGRPAEAGDPRAGPDETHPNDSRAPLMARVSFADAKRVGIALGWIVLYAVIGIGLTIGISNMVPGWGGPGWSVFRNGAYEVIAFVVATVVVGKLLNKYSWDRMGWHTQPGGVMPRLLRGVGLGGLMAMLAIGLAFVIDRTTVHYTGDWSVWPRVVLPLALGLLLAALGEELMFRGYPLRRLADAIGPLPAMLILAVLFGLAHAKND